MSITLTEKERARYYERKNNYCKAIESIIKMRVRGIVSAVTLGSNSFRVIITNNGRSTTITYDYIVESLLDGETPHQVASKIIIEYCRRLADDAVDAAIEPGYKSRYFVADKYTRKEESLWQI